ncbi:hypothetical protein EDC48_11278 [Gibbsiella quercinecans]|uniref:Uncharacterized protein n=1 Tax=Gibbsiella quercinecans TaxID=929813 RepID=A0A250B4H4_9GAMM|nr:hypothetical protein [Gibbsiella quercinecans]ATA21037.1 hypothetical protein AWC35_17745 [Gibbsiella quercinecans]RLM11683.1 hypothetical protein BIY30_07880 [Gibbsiella quercinecans]TCT86783.1 hypothetical protein EDC48_11278 [Gibbsiella quercinecans]
MMIYSSREDAIADNYFNKINVLSFSTSIPASITILTLEHPQPIAWFFLGITTLFALKEGKGYKKISHSYVAKYKGLMGNIALLRKMNLFCISIVILTFIALGELSLESVYQLTGFKISDL